MRRLAPVLSWSLLVPYFWVKSLNSRPFFGEDREFANRVNGLLALALIFTFIVFAVLNVTSSHHLLESKAFDVGVYGVGCVAAAALVTRERERRYLPLYEAMPRNERRAFGFAVLALFAVAVTAAMLPTNTHAAATKSLSCQTDAEEMTADCS